MKKQVLLLFTGACFIMSCVHEPIFFNRPVVTVSTGDTIFAFQNGDTLHLNISMSDEDELHEAFISVITPSDSDTFFYFQPYVHELPSYSLDTFCVITGVSTLKNGFISVKAHNHHDGITEIDIPIDVFP